MGMAYIIGGDEPQGTESADRQNMRTGEQHTVIVGLGSTGLACARYLSRTGQAFVVVDSRPSPPQLEALKQSLPEAQVHLGGFDLAIFRAASQVIVSPGVSLREPVLARAAALGIPVLGDIELFARAADAPVIAVTGSNGKSTVTSMVGAMVSADGREVRVGGNLGPPALDLLDGPAPDLYVLELSSFQLEATDSLRPAAAVVLNISGDHLDRYPSINAYAAAKERVFRGEGVMVINLDDPRVVGMARAKRQVIEFGLRPPRGEQFGLVEHRGKPWLACGRVPLLAVDALPLAGRHNVANALAALALGSAAGLSVDAMVKALRAFKGLPHRCEYLPTRDGLRWYNDSKATNVGAAVAAINGLDVNGAIVLIAGGDGKGADFIPLRKALLGRARGVVVLGRDAAALERALTGVAPIVRVGDMGAAVGAARRLAREGDTVVLSPACSSLDMYRNFEARGDAFANAVMRAP